MCRELGRLVQKYENVQGTDTIKFLTLDKIRNIPANKKVTYTRIVVDYHIHKSTEPN